MADRITIEVLKMAIDEILNNLPKYQETEEQSEKRKQEWIEQRD